MKVFAVRCSQLYLQRSTNTLPIISSSAHPPTSSLPSKSATIPRQTRPNKIHKPLILEHKPKSQKPLNIISKELISFGDSRCLILGAVSVGFVLFVMGFDEQKALAFGPEGPLVEEFWDNVRRYALYALTVSTGALYTILQPIFELLKNPISAILILTILGGGFFIVSQVVSAMVGITDFSYDYAN
ncbi:hypothetical protein UlMin_016595 [Ulmus minor]